MTRLPETTRQTAGFSLVELSIVLVILGLLTGGILAGQSLIHASEIRAVTTEFHRYVTATQTFRDKYFALPGDMTSATSFWGSLGGTGSDAACQTLSATGAATCNGNGNGQVLTNTAVTYDEPMRYWQHLANAGLIEGQYSGKMNAASPYFTAGIVPYSKYSNRVWSPYYYGTYAGTTQWFAGAYDNFLQIGGAPDGNYGFKPEDVWNIDLKLDDGLPAQGRVVAWKGSAAYPCTSRADQAVAAADAAATYNLTESSTPCRIFFPRSF